MAKHVNRNNRRKGKKADPNRMELIRAVMLAGCGLLYLYEMKWFGSSKVLEGLGYLFFVFSSMHFYRYFSNREK